MLHEDISYYKTNAVLSNNNLPVSSLEFLIQDLTKTYNSLKSSSSRFLSGKNVKDHIRYDELIHIKSMDDDIKPYHYVRNSPLRVIADNPRLRNYETLKSDREKLDSVISFPTEEDIRSKPVLIEKYDKFVDFFKSYYDSVKIKRSKVLTTYDIQSMEEEIKRSSTTTAKKPRNGGKARKGGLKLEMNKSISDVMDTMKTGIYSGINKGMKTFNEFTQQHKEPESTPEYSEEYSLVCNELLRSLVTNNNLINSYAFNINVEDYDDLFINVEMELLKYAEYIITDDDIVPNENIKREYVEEYKEKFYNNIVKEFFEDTNAKVPVFKENQDYYEIDWTDNINNSQLRELIEIIDNYGGCSLLYYKELKKKKTLLEGLEPST